MRKSVIFALFCLLPLLMACSNSDDVTDIFVAKTWRLNMITSGGKNQTWYNFTDVTEENFQAYADHTKEFTMTFSGIETDNIISGTFSGSGSLAAGGKWSANGKNGTFTTSEVYGDASDATDVIAQKILYGLQHAKSYSGDVNNLYIYFDYNGETLQMSFGIYSK